MQIAKNKVVTIDYTLKDDDGNVIDSSDNREALSYFHGGRNIIPGLENALEGKVAGDTWAGTIAPEEGYGERDDTKVQAVSRDVFPSEAEVSVGAQFHASGPNGEPFTVTVMDVQDEQVVVDGNHPLAGKNLNFDVKVVEVRDATDEEISHGHAHGPGGHHHD